MGRGGDFWGVCLWPSAQATYLKKALFSTNWGVFKERMIYTIQWKWNVYIHSILLLCDFLSMKLELLYISFSMSTRNKHNENWKTPTTTTTQSTSEEWPQPQPQPQFDLITHPNNNINTIFSQTDTTTLTQPNFFSRKRPQHNVYSKITPICCSTKILPQNCGKNWGHY